MSESNQLIEQLLKAEEDAEEVIKTARENRNQKLKSAQLEAEEEIFQFKKVEEDIFEKELASKYNQSGTDNNTLKNQSAEDIEVIKKQYLQNKEKALDFISKAVLNVDLSISDKIKQAIKLQAQMKS